MLKISLVDNARQRRVIVEGKLIAPSTVELRNTCQEARADLRGRELVIEMKHVTTISQEGENVILELINGGIRFRCHGVFTKHVVNELTRRASRSPGHEQPIECAQFQVSEGKVVDTRGSIRFAELRKRACKTPIQTSQLRGTSKFQMKQMRLNSWSTL